MLVAVCVAAFFINRQFMTEDDHAKVAAGDCFENSGTAEKPRIKKRDCGDPKADYKVLKKIDGGVTSLACSDVEGSTGALTQVNFGKASETFAVCFQSNHR
ncbi:LppU/SCO3897 family protein [Streptomyces syringium]|uniref:LppU/SCO3897 family protein n=1 Tax=Streptomyces syringium TaxID=76729 RepID=UPI003451129E